MQETETKPAETEEAVKEEETPETGKRKGRPLLVFLFTLVMAGVVLGALIASHKIVLFRHGFFLYNTESVGLEIEADEVPKLDYFPNLKLADLRGSTCAPELYAYHLSHPEVEVWYEVDLPSGVTYDEQEKTADLSGLTKAQAQDAVKNSVQYIREAERVHLDLQDWSADEMDAFCTSYPHLVIDGKKELQDADVALLRRLRETYPDVVLSGTVKVDTISVPLDGETLSLQKLKPGAGFEALIEAMPDLPAVTAVDFGAETKGHDKLEAVHAFYEAYPETDISYTCSAFGKTIDFHADKLDFNHIEMDDDGKEVRELLRCLPDVTYLDMDFCGVDDEHMAAIRDDFPDVKVVWRIWFGTQYSVRTDVEKILASAPQVGGMLTPETTKSLIYCTDLKYLDIGHNEGLRDLYFVSYMPKLEVLICMWGSITDISPLADCPHLEFLEIFTNNITDISPLSELHELKHLNMCWNTGLRDMTPIYGLTQLERLWIGTTTGIPREQVEEFKKLAPDCEVNDWCGDPHTNWRWGTERYALLQEQFGYVNYEYEFYWRDPLYYPHDDEEEAADG